MNRTCRGDYYSIKGERFYRCLGDGTVILATLIQKECPACKRAVDPVHDHGEVATKTIIKVQACFGCLGWIEHSSLVSEEFIPEKEKTNEGTNGNSDD